MSASSTNIGKVLVAVAVSGWLVACGSSSSSDSGWDAAAPASAAAEVTIEALTVFPSVVEVQKGGTVTWHNMDSVAHRLVSGSPDDPAAGAVFDSEASGGLLPFGEYSFEFVTAGDVPYHCVDHPEITQGTVRVR